MGEKKRNNKNSNKPPGGKSGSSESGDSRDPSLTPSVTKSTCQHLNRSVDLAAVRRNFKTNGQQLQYACNDCKKSVSGAQSLKCEDLWVCLRCGSCCCGPEEKNHIHSHYETPRSDSHVLALSLRDWKITCFACKFEIAVDCNKKIGTLVKTLRQQYDRHLRAIPNGVPEVSTINKKEPSESKFAKTNSNKKKCVAVASDIPRVRGLTNLGNTCFFNSVLQCLAQTHGLVELLNEMKIPGEKFKMSIKEDELICAELDKGVGSISENLASTLTQVSGLSRTDSGDRNNGNYVVNPRQLLSALRKKWQQFEGTDQHDAHELLRHLLDSVRMEDLRRYHRAIFNHVGLSSKECPEEMDENKKKQAKVLNQMVCDSVLIRPDHIFKGTLVSRLECQTCHHSSEHVDCFLDLSLPVTPEKPQPPSVARRKNHNQNGSEEDADAYWKPKQEETNRGKFEHKKKRNMRRKQREFPTNVTKEDYIITEEDRRDEDSDFEFNYKEEFAQTEKCKTTGQTKSRRKRLQSDDAEVEPLADEDRKCAVSIAEPSDADVEDNEDVGCDENEQRLDIIESGYSSEKQASPRTSPVTHSPEEDSDMFLARPQSQKRSESGLGSSTVSIQELTVTIPDSPSNLNADLSSPNSTQANASPGSQEVSSDSLQNDKHFHCDNRNDDILIRQFNSCVAFLPSNDNCVNNNSVVHGWECNPFPDQKKSDSDPENSKCLSHDSSSISIPNTPPGRDSSISQSSQDMNVNCSHKEIQESQHDNSQQEERPLSRLEFHGSVARSSPVDLVDSSEINSAILNLQLEYYKTEKSEENITDEKNTMYSLLEQSDEELTKMNESCNLLKNDSEMGFVLVGGIVESKPEPQEMKTKTQPIEEATPTEEAIVHNGPLTLAPRHKFEEGECSLQSCLYQFTAIEIMTGNNKVGCESCTARQARVSGSKESKTVYTAYTKQLLISSVPRIMIFHFKRFEVQMFSIRKISRHVKFPLILDMAPFCSAKCKSVAPGQTQILYSLYAVVEHIGSLRCGHYVAYVKVRSRKDANQPASSEPVPSKWYYVSDSRVSEVNENKVLNSEAYLLFYERLM